MLRDIVISLFDDSGNLVQPWADAGYEVHVFDILNPPEGETIGRLHRHYADLAAPFTLPFDPQRVAFASAHPPCDHLAVSGSRWFKGKGLRLLSHSISMFATAAEVCESTGAPYTIENPVSVVSTHWRKPDHIYSPYEYTALGIEDNYTKTTCLWAGGGFVMPPKQLDPRVAEAIAVVRSATGRSQLCDKPKALKITNNHPTVAAWYPDNRIHACPPGEMRAYIRSITPSSFGKAVFNANFPMA